MAKVLITPRSLTGNGHPALERLAEAGFELVYGPAGQQPSEADLLERLPGVVGWLAGVEPVTGRVLEAASDLRVIARNGVGVDNVDVEAAERASIAIRRTPGANARGVAELAVGLMFSLARAIPFSDTAIKAGRWERRKGFELAGRTLGVVGCGQIGRQVIEMASGLGMQVLGYDMFPDEAYRPSEAFRYAALGEVVAGSDVITLHCPAPEDGRPVLDAAAFERMREGVCLINTARPSLIDREALQQGLESGRVGGAALDVFDMEPPTVDALLASDRVVTTPHVGGFTHESVDRAVAMAVEQLLEVLGKEMQAT